MNRTLHTKYGTAKINNKGYYTVTSSKEDNNRKLLHRLIAADYFGEWINDPEEPFDIHHVDGNKTNNCVLNLEPIPHREHSSLHNPKGENHKDYGKHHSEEAKRKMSESRNTSGYLNVSKDKSKTCKQGFTWRYQYSENGKRKSIESVSLEKVKAKVKAKELPWMKF